ERRKRYTFAELLKRVFYMNVLRCPHCQGKRERVAMISSAPVIRAILECLKLPADPPLMAKAGWPVGLYKHT
ncbi:MAG: ATP-dependent helicase HrpA, partial [Planctomycetota bacterium]